MPKMSRVDASAAGTAHTRSVIASPSAGSISNAHSPGYRATRKFRPLSHGPRFIVTALPQTPETSMRPEQEAFGPLLLTPRVIPRMRPMPKRQSNNPKRRILATDEVGPDFLNRLANDARYIGRSCHKRNPADYGFHPPASPRPNKSLCDGGRTVRSEEAKSLFLEGIRRGMISRFREGGLPKYVWSVDADGRAFEAKIDRGTRNYHGYELNAEDEAMRRLVAAEWRRRCPLI